MENKNKETKEEKSSETIDFLHGVARGFGSSIGNKIMEGLRERAHNFGMLVGKILLGNVIFLFGIVFLGVGVALFLDKALGSAGVGFALIGALFILIGWILKIK